MKIARSNTTESFDSKTLDTARLMANLSRLGNTAPPSGQSPRRAGARSPRRSMSGRALQAPSGSSSGTTSPSEGMAGRAKALIKSSSRLMKPLPLGLRRRRSSEPQQGAEPFGENTAAAAPDSNDELEWSSPTSSSSFEALSSDRNTSVEDNDLLLSSGDHSAGEIEAEEDHRYRSDGKRRHIVGEIIATEEAYVDHLRDLLEVVFRPLEQAAKSPAASELFQRVRGGMGNPRPGDLPTLDDLKEVLSRVVSIYELNAEFLHTLRGLQVDYGDDTELQLGDAFLGVADSFKFYSAYVNKYQEMADPLQRIRETLAFKALIQEATALGRPLSIDSLLVTPIQRIPRYVLLLKELLGHTPADHPDHPKLSVVLPKMEEVANYIEKEKNKFDDIRAILNISSLIVGYDDAFIKPGRKFIKEGFLRIYDTETMRSKRRYFFLFSDVLLVTRHKRGSFFNKFSGRYQFIEALRTVASSVEPLPDSEATSSGLQITGTDGARYVLHTKGSEDRDAWVQAFQAAAHELKYFTKTTTRPRSQYALLLSAEEREDTDHLSHSSSTEVPKHEAPLKVAKDLSPPTPTSASPHTKRCASDITSSTTRSSLASRSGATPSSPISAPPIKHNDLGSVPAAPDGETSSCSRQGQLPSSGVFGGLGSSSGVGCRVVVPE